MHQGNLINSWIWQLLGPWAQPILVHTLPKHTSSLGLLPPPWLRLPSPTTQKPDSKTLRERHNLQDSQTEEKRPRGESREVAALGTGKSRKPRDTTRIPHSGPLSSEWAFSSDKLLPVALKLAPSHCRVHGARQGVGAQVERDPPLPTSWSINSPERVLVGPTWVTLPFVSDHGWQTPTSRTAPQTTGLGREAFPRRKQRGIDRKQPTSTPQRVPSVPLAQGPRNPLFL